MTLERWKALCRRVFAPDTYKLISCGPCGWAATDPTGQRTLAVFSWDFGFCCVLDIYFDVDPAPMPAFADTQPALRELES